MSDPADRDAERAEMEEAVDLFFQHYDTPLPNSGRVGVLYLVRREIITCMGMDHTTLQPTAFQAPIAGAMCVLTGIDYMGKFYAGSDERGRVRERFTAYLQRYFELDDSEDAEVIYQLRNGLLHSFGLFSRNGNRTYRFHLVAGENPLVEQYEPDHYRVNGRLLVNKWERSITLYRGDLIHDQNLQSSFFRMMTVYGLTYIGPTPETP
jgi:hypothetical protein